MTNKLPQIFSGSKICIICEGDEEYEYFDKLIFLDVRSNKYKFTLENANRIFGERKSAGFKIINETGEKIASIDLSVRQNQFCTPYMIPHSFCAVLVVSAYNRKFQKQIFYCQE